MKKEKREKYERDRFSLEECKAHINIIPKGDDPGYATAFLNIMLPDGRWLPFKLEETYRVPLYKPKKEG